MKSILFFLLLAFSSQLIAGEKTRTLIRKSHPYQSSRVAEVLEQFQPPNDPVIDKSWHLFAINAFSAWKITTGNKKVAIAFIDSGIDYKNSDLKNNLWRNSNEIRNDEIDNDENGWIDDIIGWNYVNGKWGVGNNDPKDLSLHGTFISGIAAAEANNGIGGAGVCPKCSLMTLRFLTGEGYGDTEDAILGINYAVKNGAAVINLSFAGEGEDAALAKVLTAALKNDIVVVAAAGNDGDDNDKVDTFPANYQFSNMLTVAAVDPEGKLYKNSNYGKKMVDVAAPGTNIMGPYKGGWDVGDGTSVAAPIVSATAGLMRSANPNLTAAMIVKIIKATVSKSKFLTGKVQSGGIVNTAAAVKCAADPNHSCLDNENPSLHVNVYRAW